MSKRNIMDFFYNFSVNIFFRVMKIKIAKVTREDIFIYFWCQFKKNSLNQIDFQLFLYLVHI